MKKFRSILSIIMALIMVISIFPVMGIQPKTKALESTGNAKMDAFINDYRFTNGASWGNRGPYMSPWRSSQCCAYVADFVYYCFGKSGPKTGENFKSAWDIRAGDVISVGGENGGGHWFAVLKRSGNNLYVAEGNFNSKVRIGWNYTITSANSISGTGYSFSNGWHYLNGSSGGKISENITYHDDGIQDITFNNAVISTWISNAPNNEIWSTGFYFGTSPDNMTLYTAYEHIYWTNFHCQYDLSKFYGLLSPGTTYYYRFYVVEANNFMLSYTETKSFTTAGSSDVSFSFIEPSGISYKDATISGWAHNINAYNIKSYGFRFGTDRTNLTQYEIGQNVQWTDFNIKTNIEKYVGPLTPGKEYYFRFYCLTGLYNFSDIYSFTTSSSVPSFSISFNANSGTCPTSSKTVTYNSTYGTLPTPTRTGYTFDGWYTSSTGGTKITADTKVTITANQTLYAHWTLNHKHSYTSKITKQPSCTATGVKTFTCSCGDTYTETVSALGHNFGEWKVTKPATKTSTGVETRYCSRCTAYETRTIPKLTDQKVELNNHNISINYKGKTQLVSSIKDVEWTTSNSSVATVDKNGKVTATGTGKAVVTATIKGTDISDSCEIIVSYAWWQWIIKIVLFGFLWY